jgi:hypothetical protein
MTSHLRAHAYLVFPRFPLPSQNLIDISARRRILHEARLRMRLLLRLQTVIVIMVMVVFVHVRQTSVRIRS